MSGDAIVVFPEPPFGAATVITVIYLCRSRSLMVHRSSASYSPLLAVSIRSMLQRYFLLLLDFERDLD